jgi:predicted nucleic acid-binding protein
LSELQLAAHPDRVCSKEELLATVWGHTGLTQTRTLDSQSGLLALNTLQARVHKHGEQLVAPELIDLEVVSTLRHAARAKRLDGRRSAQALTDLAALPLRRVPHPPLFARGELRDNLSAYDASYVALAEALGTVLLTADGRLGRAAGIRCEVAVLNGASADPFIPLGIPMGDGWTRISLCSAPWGSEQTAKRTVSKTGDSRFESWLPRSTGGEMEISTGPLANGIPPIYSA